MQFPEDDVTYLPERTATRLIASESKKTMKHELSKQADGLEVDHFERYKATIRPFRLNIFSTLKN